MFNKLKKVVVGIRIYRLCKKYGAEYIGRLITIPDVDKWEIKRSDGRRYWVSRELFYGTKYNYLSIWSEEYPDELGKEWCHDFFQQCVWAGILEV